MLIRWTSEPQGKAGCSAHACGFPVMPIAQVAATKPSTGFYGTRVSGNTGRPEGRGGGAD